MKEERAAITRAHAKSEADLAYTIRQRSVGSDDLNRWAMPNRFAQRSNSAGRFAPPTGPAQLTHAEYLDQQAKAKGLSATTESSGCSKENGRKKEELPKVLFFDSPGKQAKLKK